MAPDDVSRISFRNDCSTVDTLLEIILSAFRKKNLVNGFGKFTQPSCESGRLDSLIILNEGIGPVRSLFPDRFREKKRVRDKFINIQ